MKLINLFKTTTLTALLALTFQPAHAEKIMCSYTTHISEADKHNSKGQLIFSANDITSVANILRQDRANLYDIGSGNIDDSNDQADCLFDTQIGRERIYEMLGDGYISQHTINAIVNDTPDIRVDVFPTGIHVYLVE